LASDRTPILSSGQVAEKILGYDAAAAPAAGNLVWRVLEVPRPRGVVLVPTHWPSTTRPPAGQLPGYPVSLILQYKRPTYLESPRAGQWRLWHQPYFRFERSARQHSVLSRLERRLGGDALVRYAASAFWRRGELERAHLQRSVLALSGFVSPHALGKHRVWTYIEPGNDGRGNPAGERVRFETFEQVLGTLVDRESTSTGIVRFEGGLQGHLGRVGVAARDREPALRSAVTAWSERVRRQLRPDLSVEQIEQLRDLASIVSLVTAMKSSWHLVLGGAGERLMEG
jgi:hypothetical protein